MTAPIATITAARLVGTAISPSHFGEINRLHTDPQVMGLPVILLDGRSQTSPLASASTLENKEDRDYFGPLNHDKTQRPPPCIRCYWPEARSIGICVRPVGHCSCPALGFRQSCRDSVRPSSC